MARRIAIEPQRCIGCRLCSVACSITKTGAAGLAEARIWVAHFGRPSVYVPVTCTHCAEAWCERACPTGAIAREAGTGLVRLEESKCIGCRLCVQACPFGAVGYSEDRGRALKCDTCGGDPACARICPTHAVRFEQEGNLAHLRRRETALKLLASPPGVG